MDKREFWSTKSPLPEYHAVAFSHPSFDGPIRLVANQFTEVTLGGFVHTPAPMSIKPPDQVGGQQAKLTMSFPRAVVGREFKKQISKVTADRSRDPITVTYSVFLDNLASPAVTWSLYVSDESGILFNEEAVQVAATDTNPMRRAVAPIYDPSVFTGLEIL
jgi:hypothetical protein